MKDKAQKERWIEAVLTNDETSSDEELALYFMDNGLTKREAVGWILIRDLYLNKV